MTGIYPVSRPKIMIGITLYFSSHKDSQTDILFMLVKIWRKITFF